MMEPNPAEIYFSPQVDNVLLRTKLRKARIRTVIHSFPFGTDVPFAMKNMKYAKPPMNCLIAASCNAGMYLTPSRDAIQVVPQKNETSPSAMSALALLLFLWTAGKFSVVNFFSNKLHSFN
jgi:hypothetical protein